MLSWAEHEKMTPVQWFLYGAVIPVQYIDLQWFLYSASVASYECQTNVKFNREIF